MCAKRIISVMLLIIVFISISTFSLAINTSFYEPGEMSQKDSEKTGEITGDILAVIRTIGIIASVVVLTIIGLKYIFSSVEEKAEYKQTIAPYVIGCVLLVSATTVPSMVYNISQGDKPSTGTTNNPSTEVSGNPSTEVSGKPPMEAIDAIINTKEQVDNFLDKLESNKENFLQAAIIEIQREDRVKELSDEELIEIVRYLDSFRGEYEADGRAKFLENRLVKYYFEELVRRGIVLSFG